MLAIQFVVSVPRYVFTFRLDDYRWALAMNMNKSRHRMVHSAFVFD